MQYLYVAILHYNVGMNIVKISFLFQYRRIFQSSRVHKVCCWVIIGVILWACVQATLLGTSCLPISILVPSTAGWCLDTLPIWYFSSAMSIATDILIFCIPLPSVLKLQLPMKQKVMVILIFCLGFLSVYTLTPRRSPSHFITDDITTFIAVFASSPSIACAPSVRLFSAMIPRGTAPALPSGPSSN